MALFLTALALSLPSTLSTPALTATARANFMNCGSAPYCGVLVLERGGGIGNYNHPNPQVHGLWPENGKYGNSRCVGGSGNNVPHVSCYTDPNFQLHEWQKHGECAASDPTTFFNEVCALSSQPLQIMSDLKAQGASLDEMALKLADRGFPVFNRNAGNDQLELSVCAATDAVWKFSAVDSFSTDCGKSTSGPK